MSDTPETEFIPFGPEWEAFTMKLPKKFLIKQLRESCLSYHGARQLSAFHLNEALKIADERDKLRAINAEMLTALNRFDFEDVDLQEGDEMDITVTFEDQQILRATISKAKEAQP